MYYVIYERPLIEILHPASFESELFDPCKNVVVHFLAWCPQLTLAKSTLNDRCQNSDRKRFGGVGGEKRLRLESGWISHLCRVSRVFTQDCHHPDAYSCNFLQLYLNAQNSFDFATWANITCLNCIMTVLENLHIHHCAHHP